MKKIILILPIVFSFVLSLITSVSADIGDCPMSGMYGMMSGSYGLGMGIFGWLFGILVLIILILLIIWLVKQIQKK